MDAPAEYKTVGTMMLVSAVVNIIAALAWTLVLLMVCVGVAWLVPLGFAVFELVVGINALSNKPQRSAKAAAILGLIAGILCMNPVSIVLEILVLVKLGQPDVARYITEG